MHISGTPSKTTHYADVETAKLMWNNYDTHSITGIINNGYATTPKVMGLSAHEGRTGDEGFRLFEQDKDILNIGYGNADTPSHYIQFYSPTSKKICFISSYAFAASWLDILSAHPELTEDDIFTARFGTRLYYVRLPSLDELKLFLNLRPDDVHLSGIAIGPSTVEAFGIWGKQLYIQPNKKKIKTIRWESYNENPWTKKHRLIEDEVSAGVPCPFHLVLTPIEESDAPYRIEKLRLKYPNFDFLELLSKENGKETKTLNDGKIKIFKKDFKFIY